MAGNSIADIVGKAKARRADSSDKPKPQARRMNRKDKIPVKLLIYGPSGTGKTYTIIGLLLAGERVFVVSTDFGSNGLVTVRNALDRMGKSELYENNLMYLDLGDYEEVADFLEKPLDMVPDLYDFNPTVIVWEGFTSYNVDYLDEYILKHAPGAENSGELRHAGFTHTKQDWQGMKRGTMRGLRKFISFRLPDGEPGKILTALEEGVADSNEFSGQREAVKGPLVHGGAKKLMAVAFDVILNTYRTDKKDEGLKFYYRAGGSSDKYLVKSRGYDINPIELAEPERIWKIISKRGGLTDEERKAMYDE